MATGKRSLPGLGLMGAAVVALALIQAPQSSAADERSGDAGALATSYVGDTCSYSDNKSCLYLHYNSYDPTYLRPRGACHMSSRTMTNHWGVVQGTEIVRYVFRTYNATSYCNYASGSGVALVNDAASYFNDDCVRYQVYSGTSGQGGSHILSSGSKGPLNSSVLNTNESHYRRGTCS
ncbi:hypothetical protein [Streptomyces sp. NPDC004134]|uniref:hypothetical protein n=1 Tax=Streptomyces sp. NPDC004134 TaxID=3364691 RepID=UPI0036C3C065